MDTPIEEQPSSASWDILGHLDPSAPPEELLAQLQQLPVMGAVAGLVIGLVVMVWGLRLYKIVVVFSAAGLGVMGGLRLGEWIGWPWMTAGVAAVVLGVAAWPLLRLATAMLFGVAGAMIAGVIWMQIQHPVPPPEPASFPLSAWLVMVPTFAVLSLITAVFFNYAVTLYTSLQGAVMVLACVSSLVMKHDDLGAGFQETAARHRLLLPVIALVLSFIGTCVQLTLTSKKKD